MLDRTFGDEAAEAVIMRHLTKKTLTQDIFNQYAHRLGQATKSAGYIFIQPEIAEAKERNSQLIQAKQRLFANATEAPAKAAIAAGQASEGTSINVKTIKMLGMSEEFRDELPPLNTDLFKIAYENAQSDLTKLHINDKKPLPTAEEMNEATKPIVDQYNKVLQERKVILDKHSLETKRKRDKRNEAITAKVNKEVPRYEDFIDEGFFASGEFTPDETKGLYAAVEAGTLKHLPPAQVDLAVGTALISDIRNGDHNVASALKHLKTQFSGLDINNLEHRKLMGKVISDGLDASTLDDLSSTLFGSKDKTGKKKSSGATSMFGKSVEFLLDDLTGIPSIIGDTKDASELLSRTGRATTPGRHEDGTALGRVKSGIGRFVRTPFEAVGLIDTFEDELRKSFISGEIFTPAGLKRLKTTYPNPAVWGDIEGELDSLRE